MKVLSDLRMYGRFMFGLAASRHRRAAIIVALLGITAASCARGGDDTAMSGDPVRAVVLPYLSLAPLHIAADEGYFVEQGVDVEFVRLGRNQEIMAALARGDVDVAAGMLTVNELNLAASGARVRMVASLGHLVPDGCTFAAIIVRREHVESGAVQDPERIRRLKIDADILIPLGYWLDELVAPYRLSLADLEIVDLPSPAAFQAMEAGSIDVTMDTEPWISLLQESGKAVVWKSVAELLPDFIISVVMYGSRMLDEEPELGERFATATLQAIRQFGEGKTPANLAIVERATGLTSEQVGNVCWPTVTEHARIDAASFDGYQEWVVAQGWADRVLAEDELFDHRFIDAANAALDR